MYLVYLSLSLSLSLSIYIYILVIVMFFPSFWAFVPGYTLSEAQCTPVYRAKLAGVRHANQIMNTGPQALGAWHERVSERQDQRAWSARPS